MKTVIALSAVLAIAACSQTKQLEEMHDSTKQMNDTTRDMNKTTSDLDAKMGTLKEITKGLCRGSSQALPLQARQMTLNQMDRAVRGLDKINWAVTYVEGFDFQVWPLCQTSESEVDHMLDDAVLEFFQVIQRYETGRLPNPFVEAANTDASGSAIDDNDAKDLSFNTLAVALNFVNRNQLDHHDANPAAPVYSFLSVIEETLKEGVKVERGEKSLADLKPYQRDLLANRDVAVKLLQARQQAETAIVVGAASRVAVGSMKNTLNMALDRYIKLLKIEAKPWTFIADSWNEAMIDRNTKFLKDAVETRSFLKSIGVAPQMDANLVRLTKGMQPLMTKGAIAKLSQDSRRARGGFAKVVKDLKATLN